MITAVAISGYRSLRDLVLPLDRLNVVTGANGSGKSSLYRALRLLGEAALNSVVSSLAREGGLPSTLWDGPESIARGVRQGDYRVEGTAASKPASLKLGFGGDTYGYSMELGYTWEELIEGADTVGKRIISQFKPDIVLSFAGPGAVFANLVLARTLNRKSLSAMRLYMGRFLDKGASLDAAVSEDYDIVTGERMHVLLPKGLQQGDRSWKIAILDETVTTGSSMRSIKKYLNDLGYRNIRAGCLVCCEGAKLVDPDTVDFAAYSNVGNTFVLPWGKSPL